MVFRRPKWKRAYTILQEQEKEKRKNMSEKFHNEFSTNWYIFQITSFSIKNFLWQFLNKKLWNPAQTIYSK